MAPSAVGLLIETIEPHRSNIGLAGTSITQIPALAEAAAKARETLQPQLVSDGTDGPNGGFFLIQPVYNLADADGEQASGETQSPFLGWLIAPVDIDRYFEASNIRRERVWHPTLSRPNPLK